MSPGVRTLVWLIVGLIWLVSFVAGYRWDRRQATWHESDPVRDAFASAQDHYLKGNWFEAERILSRLLAENPRDLDAGMMRATLFRHTKRYDEASGELERIERFEDSRKWELEIRRERELIEQATKEEPTTAGETENDEPIQPITGAA